MKIKNLFTEAKYQAKNLMTGQTEVWPSKAAYNAHKQEYERAMERQRRQDLLKSFSTTPVAPVDRDTSSSTQVQTPVERPVIKTFKQKQPQVSQVPQAPSIKTSGAPAVPTRNKKTSGSVSHDYSAYPAHDIDNDDEGDDEDTSWAGSKVADKAVDSTSGQYGANSILVNETGERIVIQSFFSAPMILDSKHQILNSSSAVDTELYNDLRTALQNFNTASKGGQGKVQYANKAEFNRAIGAASQAITQAFNGKNLSLYRGTYPIYWVNPGELSNPKALTFALTHWIKVPANTDDQRYGNSYADLQKYADQIEHYIFGYADTAGIAPDPQPKQLISAFNVGTIERVMQFYGIGANSLKRLSALKASRALGMKSTGGYEGQYELKALDYQVSGKILREPWREIRSSVRSAYSKNPAKVEKLDEVLDQIIGQSPATPAKYPVVIKDVSVKNNGFSANALTVDFMELLHPLVAMKPNGVINNGIYNAAHTFLSQPDENGKYVFDLQRCAVAYPDAANAKLFDSMLINPTTGGRLLISSKEREGAMPSVSSLGSVYNLLSQELDQLERAKAADPEFKSFVLQDNQDSKVEFKQLLKFFGALVKGISSEQQTALMPTDPAAKTLANEILTSLRSRDDAAVANIAAKLNSWNGGRSFSRSKRGEFIKYCSKVMRFTPLVQINTQVDRAGGEQYDRGDDVTITGFLATWPNKIFDDIEFHAMGQNLRFKIAVGGAEGVVSTRVANVRDREGKATAQRQYVREPDFNKWKGRDYTGKMQYRPRYAYTSKINKMNVPGFEKSWNSLVNDMYRKLEQYSNPETLSMKEGAKKSLRNLYSYAAKFIKSYGNDPGMSGKANMTTRDLLNRVAEIIAKG